MRMIIIPALVLFFCLGPAACGNSSPDAIFVPADRTPPSVPTGLFVTAVTSSSISLTWNPSTDNVAVDGYLIYRTGPASVSVSGNSYTDTNLTENTSYTYTVAAFDTTGNVSAESVPVSTSTSTAGSF